MKLKTALLFAAISAASTTSHAQVTKASPVDKLTNHNDPQRTGWNPNERRLTPAAVAGGKFGALWSSPQLDGFNGTPPRLFAAPLYMKSVRMTGGEHAGKTFSVTYAVTTTGYAYAISTAASGGVAPGTILWRKRLTETPCGKGTLANLATPVIDPKTNRLYVTSCSDPKWQVHALDIRSGEEMTGWPVDFDAATMNQPGMNRNGTTKWVAETDDKKTFSSDGKRAVCRTPCYTQRGGLGLSQDGDRLYLTFGPDGVGWLVAVDTRAAKVATAFTSIQANQQEQGGMWASGGPAIDRQGRIHVSTGANLIPGRLYGLSGVCPECDNAWGQTIMQFVDDRQKGLTLKGTYTPYNYCQASKTDIDIGSSGVIVFDLPKGSSTTTNLLSLGGGKQGNIYLLDRDHMPGGLTKRQPCTDDPSHDTSLLAPEPQPEFGKRGPINLFKPFSDDLGAFDQAKSRSTAAYFRDARGNSYVYVSGSKKIGETLTTDAPPGLARVKVVTEKGKPAFLRIDGMEETQTFKNPGNPVVTSNGGRDGIVWVLDNNAPRTANLYGAGAPKPVLYAFDALSFRLLWKTGDGELFTSGKYNEPTIADGVALVGTDRIQAFGLRAK
jgi:hypothetical protein